MAAITHIDVESNFTPYKVTLYQGGIAEIHVVKTNRNGAYLQAIKRGSQTFNRVLRDARKLAQPGSLLAEQFAEFDRAEAHGYEVTEGFGRDAGWHWRQGDDCDDSAYATEAEAWQACCDDNNLESERESWSSVNGAWIICDVFPIEDMSEERSSAPRYASLADCFDDATLIAARAL